jgi:hypothetical protein
LPKEKFNKWNLVNMRMRCQWSTGLMAQSSQNIKDTRRKTDLSANFSQLQTGSEILKMMIYSMKNQK